MEAEVPPVEEPVPAAVAPLIEEVEAIVPGAALKVVEETTGAIAKKRKVTKAKESPKVGEKGPSV